MTGFETGHEASTQPNILVITCHDLGRFLGCYGVPTVHTPNLDRLAGDGILFRQAFCAAPQCSPSRASLFTGRYPHSHGVMGLTHDPFGWDLPDSDHHLASILKSAGYATSVFGVSHEARSAERCGYDVAVPPSDWPVVNRHALEHLRRHAAGEQPFFMHLGYREPHRLPNPAESGHMGFLGNHMAPDDQLGVTIPPYIRGEPSARVEMAELQGAVRTLDAAIGEILEALDTLGLAHDTLVVFTTDHGLALPRAKCSLYDPGLEIALILRWSGRGWLGGRSVSSLVSNVDIAPTLLEALGLPVSDTVQGASLMPLLDQEAASVRDCIYGEMTYHEYYDPRRCVRTDRHKLIVNFSTAPSFMDPSQSWRPRTIPVVPEDPATSYHVPVELYDLEADPLEHHNLAGNPLHGDSEARLLGMLSEWMQATDDPLLHGAVPAPAHGKAAAALSQRVHTS